MNHKIRYCYLETDRQHSGNTQGNMDLEKLVQAIRQIEQIDAIYLYGSRAKGYAREDSDWDIAVLFSNFEPDLLERAVRPQMLEAEMSGCFLMMLRSILLIYKECLSLCSGILSRGKDCLTEGFPRFAGWNTP